MKYLTMYTLIVLFVVAGAISAPQDKNGKREASTSATTSVKSVYTCPMHADVRSDAPGKCPKCGMALVENVQKAAKTSEGTRCAGMCCEKMKSGQAMKSNGSCPADSTHGTVMSMKGCCGK